MRDWSLFHNRNIIRESVGNFSKLQSGMIVRFNYSGEYTNAKRSLVLILNPRYKNKLHGLVLDNISDRLLFKLRELVQETTQARIQKLFKLRLPLLSADVQDPRRFYETRLRPFIRTHFSGVDRKSPYRTYIVGNIKNLRLIDYRFKDFYVGSTGRDEDISGKTRKK